MPCVPARVVAQVVGADLRCPGALVVVAGVTVQAYPRLAGRRARTTSVSGRVAARRPLAVLPVGLLAEQRLTEPVELGDHLLRGRAYRLAGPFVQLSQLPGHLEAGYGRQPRPSSRRAAHSSPRVPQPAGPWWRRGPRGSSRGIHQPLPPVGRDRSMASPSLIGWTGVVPSSAGNRRERNAATSAGDRPGGATSVAGSEPVDDDGHHPGDRGTPASGTTPCRAITGQGG